MKKRFEGKRPKLSVDQPPVPEYEKKEKLLKRNIWGSEDHPTRYLMRPSGLNARRVVLIKRGLYHRR